MRSALSLPKAATWAGALVLITVLGTVLRFAALDAKTLWLDEAFSLWLARHNLADLTAWLVRIDHHPPLYYILLHYWIGWFGDGPTALRSLSALASSLAIPIFGEAARKLVGARVALIATLLLALSPFSLRYAQETRMYAVLVLTVALLLWALAHLLTTQAARTWHWWLLLSVAESAAMLTHNTATVLVPLALNVGVMSLWVARRTMFRGPAAGDPMAGGPVPGQRAGASEEYAGMRTPHFVSYWILSQLAALLLWAPWSLAFIRQAQTVDEEFWIESPTLWMVWMALGNLTFAHLPVWLPLRDYMVWLALALVAVGLWQWRQRAAMSWLLLALWLVPPMVELLASVRRPIFYDRTLIWTTLPYAMLIARGMVWPASTPSGWRRAWLTVTLTLVMALSTLGVMGYFRDFAKEDWDKAAAFVAADAQPDDLLLFHASWAELPFAYYYPENAPTPVTHGIPVDLFDAGAVEPPMTAADVPRVLALTEGRARVWLVYSHWWYTDPNRLLLRTLEEHLEVAEARMWPGIQVIEYRRR